MVGSMWESRDVYFMVTRKGRERDREREREEEEEEGTWAKVYPSRARVDPKGSTSSN
jgi:hypothetical protein